jgi:hypothetical protein
MGIPLAKFTVPSIGSMIQASVQFFKTLLMQLMQLLASTVALAMRVLHIIVLLIFFTISKLKNSVWMSL